MFGRLTASGLQNTFHNNEDVAVQIGTKLNTLVSVRHSIWFKDGTWVTSFGQLSYLKHLCLAFVIVHRFHVI
jgi:hypothetical protein